MGEMSTSMHSRFGNVRRGRSAVLSVIVLAASFVAAPLLALEPSPGGSPLSNPAAAAQDKASGQQAAPAGMPSEAEMMKMMMEMAKLNENHKLLGSLAGTWAFTTKMWMNPDPKAPPSESKGTAVRKPVMEGRYFIVDVTGKMPMPGPDGKIKEMDFKGMSIEGYDNGKKKFVATWIDNMSTMIMMSEGTYDATAKTFTYNTECEMMPGRTTRIREVVKIVDNDHHTFEWYDDSRGTEAKTMEISYTRKK